MSDIALNVKMKKATIRFSDTTAKNLFTLPKNAFVMYFLVDVDTAFNGAGTDFLDLGKSGNATYFANDVDVSAANQILVMESNLGDIGSSVIQVTGIYAGAATAGLATVTCVYGHYST